jgi:hypothetical protein
MIKSIKIKWYSNWTYNTNIIGLEEGVALIPFAINFIDQYFLAWDRN